MRVLLTGSNGFVGGWTAWELRRRGHEVVGLGRRPGPVHRVDRYLRHDLSRPLEVALDVDAVLHCAALASPWARPRDFESANVDGTRHVVDWCAAHGAPDLALVSSTSVLYRDADQVDLTEGEPPPSAAEQINVYSRTKRQAERIVEAGAPGRWSILRPRAVFGPGDTVLFPRLLRAAEAGRLPWIRRPDGLPVRIDLIGAATLASFLATALERRVEGLVHLTQGEPVDLKEFLADLFVRLGLPVPARTVPLRTARFAAAVAETVSALFLGYREPPVTRFGVSVFAWSKTFDVARSQELLGPPAFSLAEEVDRFVEAVRSGRAEIGPGRVDGEAPR